MKSYSELINEGMLSNIKKQLKKKPDMSISYDTGSGLNYCSYPELDGKTIFCAGDDGEEIEIDLKDVVEIDV